MIRQMFSWIAMSMRIDTRIANAKAAPRADGERRGLGEEPRADGRGGHQEHGAEEARAPRVPERYRLRGAPASCPAGLVRLWT